MSWKSIIDRNVESKSSTLTTVRENRALVINSFKDIMEYDIRSLKNVHFDPYAKITIKNTNPLYASTKGPILDAFVSERVNLYGQALVEYTKEFETIVVNNRLLSSGSIEVFSHNDKQATVTILTNELIDIVRARMQEVFP